MRRLRRSDASLMAARCARCGLSTEIEELFANVRRSFSRRRIRLCPRCVRESSLRTATAIHFCNIGFIALCALVVLLRPEWHVTRVARNLALFVLAYMPVMLLHEAGHAAMGRLLGFRSYGVVVGFGRLLWRSSVWGVPVEWRAIPMGAVTRAALVSSAGARWRMALFAFAGPLANLLALALVWPRVPGPDAWAVDFGYAGGLALGWAGANALCAAGNLIPFRHANPLGLLASDGLLIVQALRAGPGVVSEWLRARFLLEAFLAHEARRYEDALASVREGLAAYPGDPQLTSWLGGALLRTGQAEAAREVFLGLLATGLSLADRAIMLSNVAWCDFVSAREDRLDEALQCSEEAFDQLAWMPAVQNTRGAVLVWAERAQEALPLLRAALAAAEAPGDRASVACVLSMACAALAQRDAAKHALEQARALDPACPLLERATAAVG